MSDEKSVHSAEPAHTDHPLRHFDRTCPACVQSAERGWTAARDLATLHARWQKAWEMVLKATPSVRSETERKAPTVIKDFPGKAVEEYRLTHGGRLPSEDGK